MFSTLSIIGAKYLFIVIAGIAFVYFLRQPRVEQKRLVLFAVLTLPLTYLVSKLGALLYNDPQPFIAGHFIPLMPHDPVSDIIFASSSNTVERPLEFK
jgi:hypothetical protein